MLLGMAKTKARTPIASIEASTARPVSFRTTLTGHENMEVAAVVITPDVHEKLGGAGRIPVRGHINGGPEFRTTICRMGGELFFIVNRKMRDENGVKAGDDVNVALRIDDQPRTVQVPPDLAAVLKKAKLRDTFDAMSYTHQKEYVNAIAEAKRPETRRKRIDGCMDMVRQRAAANAAKSKRK